MAMAGTTDQTLPTGAEAGEIGPFPPYPGGQPGAVPNIVRTAFSYTLGNNAAA